MSASENRDLYLLRHAMQSGVIDERTALARAYGLGLEAAAKAVPTTWIDPLLSGQDKVGTYDASIEPLLRALVTRIRALKE